MNEQLPLPFIHLDDDKPRARYGDSITSHQAADSNTNRAVVEAFVLKLFTEYGAMTDAELTDRYFSAEGHPDAHIDSPRKRRSDLKDRQVLVAMGNRRSPSGRNMQAWGIATPFPPVPAKDVA